MPEFIWVLWTAVMSQAEIHTTIPGAISEIPPRPPRALPVRTSDQHWLKTDRVDYC